MSNLGVYGRAMSLLALPLLLATDPAAGDVLVPVDQDRFTYTFADNTHTPCGDPTSDGDAALGFEHFVSMAESSHSCSTVFVNARAAHNSEIGAAALTASGSAEYSALAPGNSVWTEAISNFRVTFRLPAVSDFTLDGRIIGDGQVPSVESSVRLTGPGGQTFVEHVLLSPFPPGEPTLEPFADQGRLPSGEYVLHARASAGDLIDQANVLYQGAAWFEFTFTVVAACPADLDGDGQVGLSDLAVLLSHFGTPGGASPQDGDLDDDGDVDLSDLAALLARFGTVCP